MKRDLESLLDEVITLAKRFEQRVRGGAHDELRRRAARAIGESPRASWSPEPPRGVSLMELRLERGGDDVDDDGNL
jgi:hypothetical protein